MKYTCLLSESYEERLDGNIVLTNLTMLYMALAEKEITSIQFSNEYIKKFFTKTGFKEFITQINKMHPYTELKYNSVYDSDYYDTIIDLNKVSTAEDLTLNILKDKKHFFNVFKTLVKSYLKPEKEIMSANNKVANLHLEISNHLKEQEEDVKTIKLLTESIQSLEIKYESLISMVNHNYNKKINPSILNGIEELYPRYKGILYIKDVTRVHYVDTLIHYILEIMKTMYGYPTRLLVIEPPFAHSKIKLYPKLKNYSQLTYEDVRMNNIFMAGYHPKLINDILKNPSSLDYLIILDRSGADNPYVTGPKIKTLYTVSDLKDIEPHIKLKEIISYNTNTWHIPYISDFEELTPETKFIKYSSMPIVKHLINLLEGGIDF